MSVIFFLLAIVCLVYFGVIVSYSGIGTEYCWIWIAVAAVFIMMGVFHYAEKKDRDGMPHMIPIFVYTTFVVAALFTAMIMASVIGEAKAEPADGCDYVCVIGERVYEDGISTTLKYRLDRTVEYYNENPGTMFILSGGMTKNDVVPEALAMYNYLVMMGVPENHLIIDTFSQSTSDSVKVSLKLIEQDQKVRMVPPPVMIGIITSDYNQMRAVHVAAKEYQDKVYSIPAGSDRVMFPHQCAVEVMMVAKDYMVGNI